MPGLLANFGRYRGSSRFLNICQATSRKLFPFAGGRNRFPFIATPTAKQCMKKENTRQISPINHGDQQLGLGIILAPNLAYFT